MGRRHKPDNRSENGRRKGAEEPGARGASGDLWQRLWNLNAQFRDSEDVEKVLKAALRLSLEMFGAQQGCVVEIPAGADIATVHFSLAGGAWDEHLLGSFLRGRDVSMPDDIMISRLRRNGRMWGALVVCSVGAAFDSKTRQSFSTVGSAAAALIERMDRERARQVRARIDQEILAQRRPKDLFYKLLHGIRSLTDYDHSSSLLTFNEAQSELELVAEQIAWRKAKSQRIGLKIPVPEPLRRRLLREDVLGFDRNGNGWTNREDPADSAIAELVDFRVPEGPTQGRPTEGSVLIAPLVTRDGALGVLKVASIHAGSLGTYEMELIAQFLPQAATILRNVKRTETLELQVLSAERKHAMADLARGVSHDVNNALGAVLPLVQQLQEDASAEQLDPRTAAEDLREIERSLRVCRRIFGGMLSFARSGARNPSEVHLHHEIETTLGILREGLTRRGILVDVSAPPDLPPVWAVQADVEQLLLNLIGNARDAMKTGDRLTITVRRSDPNIELSVQDTGCGISPSNLPKVQEPFFTTKATGNGLGLAICRSIAAELRGRLQIESAVGVGTTVHVSLPMIEDRSA